MQEKLVMQQRKYTEMTYRVAWLEVQFLQCLHRIIAFQSSLEVQRYQKMAGMLYQYQLMCSQILNSSVVLLARKGFFR